MVVLLSIILIQDPLQVRINNILSVLKSEALSRAPDFLSYFGASQSGGSDLFFGGGEALVPSACYAEGSEGSEWQERSEG